MFIAGRIEFLGKHTDYCGGSSLVCAIDRGFNIEVISRKEPVITLNNIDNGNSISLDIGAKRHLKDCDWSNYPEAVLSRIEANFGSKPIAGAVINFTSNLPQAAGVSSSSAFVVAVFMAISQVNNLPQFPEYLANIHNQYDLGNYLGCLENGYNFGSLTGNRGVGTFGGSQDQTAIICSKANFLSKFSFCPVRHLGDFSIPENLVFAVAASGVVAEKTGAAKDKYNRLSLMAQEIVKIIDKDLSVAQIIEKYGFKESARRLNNAELETRLRQFYVESFEIIPAVSELLARGEISKIGELVDLSHRNAREMLGNQTPETNFLQTNARENGAIASSAFGAGFGGSVYALIEADSASDFLTNWQENYLKQFPERAAKAEFFLTKAGASRLTA